MTLRLLLLAIIVGAAGPNATAAVDYLREVKPLLGQHCYKCHGASQQKGGLRLDTASSALKGGTHGPALLPGSSDKSLILQVLNGTHPDLPQMPYKKQPLSPGQIDLIRSWIEQGAVTPATEVGETARHWSFIPPAATPVPAVKQISWARNAIDHFVLARLEKEGLAPSLEADRATLLRRVSLDLTGVPPTLDEVAAFVSDDGPGSYERVVERLLASPRFGERWGRHWLDVARYADSNGYSIDAPRSMWKYRQWVIEALNRDLPFNQFVIDQLAGDLVPQPTLEQKIATGFNRNTQINQEGGIDPEQFRVESVIDRVNTTSTTFLGLTIGCAQCHDHKFDPISHVDYYKLYAFFNNSVDEGHGQGTPGGLLEIPGEFERMDTTQKELEEATEDLDRYLNTKGSDVVAWETKLTEAERGKLKRAVQTALKSTWDQRDIQQKRIVYAAFRPDDPEFKSRHNKLTKLEKREPKPVTTLVMVDRAQPRPSHVFLKGDFTRPSTPVTPGLPAIFGTSNDAASSRTLTRLDLAQWLVRADHPLTMRVTVNRIWQGYFGKGLVETENDFGTQGSLPTHPELLDWLALELVAREGSLKSVHRQIVTSATYRQSSRVRPDLANIDANNRLWARQNRLRLDAEVVRDIGLAASGLFHEQIGGPSVFPPQPDGVMKLGQTRREWKASYGADRYRRGLYTFLWRATPHPALAVFDAPDAFSACTRRLRSNTPLQALTLLNDEAFVEFAQALARRVAVAAASDEARVQLAFQLCLARAPQPDESARLRELYQQELASYEQTPSKPAARQEGAHGDSPQLAAWTTVARVLLNLDETITRE